MAKLSPEHHKLHRLAGEWTGEEMIYPSPLDPGGRASAHTIARVEMDGFFVVSDYVEERHGAPLYRGHGVYGWDEASRTYTMHWFDSMGSAPATVARGQWVVRNDAEEELTFEHRTHSGYARYSYRFLLPDAASPLGIYVFRIESSRDARDWRPFMEGKYRRSV